MFSLIKQVFIVLLNFSSSLARNQKKYLLLNDEPCLARPTLIDLNPVEPKYYPFIITLDKCTGSCDASSPKVCVPKETKDINVKAFNMIANKNEPKTMTKHTSCDCNCNFNSTTCNSNQKLNSKTCQCECKSYHKCKEDYGWNSSTCICENSNK